jgi:hypothetical protein
MQTMAKMENRERLFSPFSEQWERPCEPSKLTTSFSSPAGEASAPPSSAPSEAAPIPWPRSSWQPRSTRFKGVLGAEDGGLRPQC